MPPIGRGCRAGGSATLRWGSHCTNWPYNLVTFFRCIDLSEAMMDWSLTSLKLMVIKIGARVVRHTRAITFQLAKVAATGSMPRATLAAIPRLRAPPLCV